MLKIAMNYCLFLLCSYQCSLVDTSGHDDTVSKSPQNQFGISVFCNVLLFCISWHVHWYTVYLVEINICWCIVLILSGNVQGNSPCNTDRLKNANYGKDIKKNYIDGTAWGTVLFAEVRLEWGKRRNRTAAVPGRSVCIHYACVIYVRSDL